MKPPKELNVIDPHGGFTAITRAKSYEKVLNEDGTFKGWIRRYKEGGTLWRPGAILKSTIGQLQEYNEQSFFQNNNDVTKAVYKVRGYCNRVAVWFDNKTGDRIA